jgi:hypothetical protein
LTTNEQTESTKTISSPIGESPLWEEREILSNHSNSYLPNPLEFRALNLVLFGTL